MNKTTKVSKNNQITIPKEFRIKYNILPKDKVNWLDTKKGILLTVNKKITEEDIISLIKEDIPYNSVEIKKRGAKGLK